MKRLVFEAEVFKCLTDERWLEAGPWCHLRRARSDENRLAQVNSDNSVTLAKEVIEMRPRAAAGVEDEGMGWKVEAPECQRHEAVIESLLSWRLSVDCLPPSMDLSASIGPLKRHGLGYQLILGWFGSCIKD